MTKQELLKALQPKKVGSESLKVIDLFCGCGGLSLGFRRAGFEIVAGIDNDDSALQTFRANLLAPGSNLDLSESDWPNYLEREIGLNNCDVLIGGPPCQGYSLTGTRNPDDPRNSLYNSMFVGLDYYQPKAVLIENVRGMATLFEGRAKQQVFDQFKVRGYSVVAKILDAADFGVPQHRLRLFFLALKNAESSLPNGFLDKDDYISCAEALSDLPLLDTESEEFEADEYSSPPKTAYQKLMRAKAGSQLKNHEATRHKQFVIDTIKMVPEGGNYKDLPQGVGESRKFNEAWTRYHSEKPSRTIDTGHRNHFHYKANRVPTVRENARLQSFPDDFEVFATRTSQNRQIGNAVPVFLSQAIARHIKNLINE
jgi:DNA (cytosine-5)-methyltransferase 1